jgi:hypothetical protein
VLAECIFHMSPFGRAVDKPLVVANGDRAQNCNRDADKYLRTDQETVSYEVRSICRSLPEVAGH